MKKRAAKNKKITSEVKKVKAEAKKVMTEARKAAAESKKAAAEAKKVTAESAVDPAYSVIIPFFNEESSVEEVLREVSGVMRDMGGAYEILAMDDGSKDATKGKIDKIRKLDGAIVRVSFPENRGQTACLHEGFKLAKGTYVITMDGDLQNDPAEIPGMVTHLKMTGNDVVCGWRRDRQDKGWKKPISRAANIFQRAVMRLPVHDISCTLRVYKKEAVKGIKLEKRGLHRFIPFIIKRAGHKLTEKEVRHRPRRHGESKYSAKKIPETVDLFFGLLFGKY